MIAVTVGNSLDGLIHNHSNEHIKIITQVFKYNHHVRNPIVEFFISTGTKILININRQMSEELLLNDRRGNLIQGL